MRVRGGKSFFWRPHNCQVEWPRFKFPTSTQLYIHKKDQNKWRKSKDKRGNTIDAPTLGETEFATGCLLNLCVAYTAYSENSLPLPERSPEPGVELEIKWEFVEKLQRQQELCPKPQLATNMHKCRKDHPTMGQTKTVAESHRNRTEISDCMGGVTDWAQVK